MHAVYPAGVGRPQLSEPGSWNDWDGSVCSSARLDDRPYQASRRWSFAFDCAGLDVAVATRVFTVADPVATGWAAGARAVGGWEGLLTDLPRRRVVVGSGTSVDFCVTSDALIVPGSMGRATAGWFPLSVGETNPSNPGRAMCVVSVNAIATPRMAQTVMTTRPTQSKTAARRPVSSLNTGLVMDNDSAVPITPRPDMRRRSC